MQSVDNVVIRFPSSNYSAAICLLVHKGKDILFRFSHSLGAADCALDWEANVIGELCRVAAAQRRHLWISVSYVSVYSGINKMNRRWTLVSAITPDPCQRYYRVLVSLGGGLSIKPLTLGLEDGCSSSRRPNWYWVIRGLQLEPFPPSACRAAH